MPSVRERNVFDASFSPLKGTRSSFTSPAERRCTHRLLMGFCQQPDVAIVVADNPTAVADSQLSRSTEVVLHGGAVGYKMGIQDLFSSSWRHQLDNEL